MLELGILPTLEVCVFFFFVPFLAKASCGVFSRCCSAALLTNTWKRAGVRGRIALRCVALLSFFCPCLSSYLAYPMEFYSSSSLSLSHRLFVPCR